VPEQDAARLRSDKGAQYQVAGLDTWQPLDITGDDPPSQLVTIGKTVNTVSRTVDVIYSVARPDPALRVGGLVQVSLPAGADFEGVIIPSSAVVDDEGREIVYVQVDGEHFEARSVTAGPRSGNLVGVQRGLKAGERIVVEGAHLVRLADRASVSEAPHGHVH
jgi:multidrug efflux pump subunit AcrA (membrane-fusion protein)